MEDNYLNFRKEIEKINQRIKEYLWKKQYQFKIRVAQQKNYRTRFLEE